MKEIILSNKQQQAYCQTWIKEAVLDGSKTVVLKSTDKSSTSKQRRLNWLWCDQVSKSGLGSNDDKNNVYIGAKWRFARPILLRDDDIYATIDTYFLDTVKNAENRSELIKQFANQYISVENMTRKQRAEYLTEFQKYWVVRGVNLTDPAMIGVDLT